MGSLWHSLMRVCDFRDNRNLHSSIQFGDSVSGYLSDATPLQNYRFAASEGDIIVVTINSMAQHGGEGMRIETFATLLFDQWQIGHAKLGGQDWNTGILLLVSRDDRKARIELGAGWGQLLAVRTGCQLAFGKEGFVAHRIPAGIAAEIDVAALLHLLPQMLRRFFVLTHGRVPLIGVGGVSSGADAYQKIRAGASLVQIYTAMIFNGPGLVSRMVAELDELLESDGFTNLRDAVGIDSGLT